MHCKICNENTADGAHFWNKHRIKRERYYAEYDPRYDVLTGELIKFKSDEQYVLTDFTDKNNLKKWITKNQDKALDYLFGKLKQYLDFKKKKFAPGQSELRTISHITIVDTFEFLGKEKFHILCEKYGVESKYNYSCPPIEVREVKKIICDSREQAPLHLQDVFISVQGLPYGDYAETQKSKLVIERKGPSDFRGTLAKDFDRFRREIQRAKDAGAYIVILVETDINSALYAKTRFEKASPEFLSHKLRELCREFDNCQFLFCDGRKEAARLVKKILSIGECVKNYDLQFWIEKGKL